MTGWSQEAPHIHTLASSLCHLYPRPGSSRGLYHLSLGPGFRVISLQNLRSSLLTSLPANPQPRDLVSTSHPSSEKKSCSESKPSLQCGSPAPQDLALFPPPSSPARLHSLGDMGLLPLLQTYQARSCLRASALAIPSAWKALPPVLLHDLSSQQPRLSMQMSPLQ